MSNPSARTATPPAAPRPASDLQVSNSKMGWNYIFTGLAGSALGRWAQPDSIIPPNQGVQGWDRYAYVNNNPIIFVDPSGHKACDGKESSDCNGFLGLHQKPQFERLPVSGPSWIQWYGGTKTAYQDHLNYEAGKDNYNYDGYCQGFHCGLDFGADWGTDVYSGIYGTVLTSWDAGENGGWKLIIQSGNYNIQYEHLAEEPMMGSGDLVTPYSLIGSVGNPSGQRDNGNFHLHLEIRYSSTGGNYKDRIPNPLNYINPALYANLSDIASSQGGNNVEFAYGNDPDPRHQPSPIQRGGGVLWP